MLVTSAEKDEKVVKPPKNPVMIKRRHCGGKSVCVVKKATAIPIKYPPIRLAATVPSDKKAEAESKIKPRTQRKTAPKDAPMLMANIEFNISKHISQWLMKFHN